jgi:ABC-type Zn uptake system ZnuABC Zn-binding protein ZnuA
MRLLLLWLAGLVWGGVFLGGADCGWAAEGLRVSTFSTVLTEVAQRVGGAGVEVTGHVPVGVDPHEFEPKPSALKVVAAADLVLLSAKHMEGYVSKLKQAAGGRARFVEVGAKLPSLRRGPSEEEHMEDPHWWHSIENMQRAVRVVCEEFSRARPADSERFEAQARVYGKELEELRQWARGRIAEIPRDRRKLVTSHGAFGYFAREFGFKVYSVEGLTLSDQPSSRAVAELLETIRRERVRTVFAQDTANPKVLRQMTAETGAVLGPRLWADGLGPGVAGTYAGMFRENVNAIVEGLK